MKQIIVFRELTEKNASLLSEVLAVGELRSRARNGVVHLRARLGGQPSRVYERLGVAVADLDPDEVRRLRRFEAVASVVPNARCHIQAIAHAENPSPQERESRRSAGHSWCLEMIGVSPGHDTLGRGAVVAVLDTGIDLAHPDLAPRVQRNGLVASFVPGESAHDGHGHGTHCAGVVVGPRRSIGGTRYGVAPEARLLVGKVLSDAGVGSTDWIIDGIDWAAANSARVISLSCLSRRPPGQPHSVVYERVARSLLEGAPGTLLLAPAGNSSARPWHTQPVEDPAACPSLLAVAAVQRSGRVASFSGRQLDATGEVNLSAPGVGVYSSWTRGGFRSLSGTSMAVPHVAGVAALDLESRPALSALELRAAIESRAVPLGDARDYGRGLVRAVQRPPAGSARER